MQIIKTEIIVIDDSIFEPAYYHPNGKFLVPIIKQETYDTGKSIMVNSHQGFWNKKDAENWIKENISIERAKNVL